MIMKTLVKLSFTKSNCYSVMARKTEKSIWTQVEVVGTLANALYLLDRYSNDKALREESIFYFLNYDWQENISI